MKVLLIDVGNSNIVIGLFEDGMKVFQARTETGRDWDSPGFTNELETIFLGHSISGNAVDGAIISSVVPDLIPILSSAIRSFTGKKPLIADRSHIDIPVRDYDMTLLGMDRMVDMIAAREKYGVPLIIYDLGTCTTMSVLDAEGCFIGGMISPGVQLGLDAEAQNTAQLPALTADSPKALLGNDTVSCMINGSVIGTAAMIDGIHERVAEEMHLDVKRLPLVLTGGLGRLVLPWMKHPAFFEPDLLLNGLEILYKKNDKRSTQC